MTARKSAASLQPGDRIIRQRLDPDRPEKVRRITTVEYTRPQSYGVVRIFWGKYGMNWFDAAGTHMFDVPEETNQ